jgi:hypothetical protein
MSLASRGTLPLDRVLAPLCSLVAGIFTVWLIVRAYRGPRGERANTRA